MSHNKDEVIICPNCGYEAKYNYCEQCGQPTHLHKETFLGLIVHFVAHYFHYDSKLIQTIKTLVLKPGQLTLEYWNNRRMGYIPPISLYIFVSSIYFISAFFFLNSNIRTFQEGPLKKQLDSVITNNVLDTTTIKVDTVTNTTTTTVAAADIPNIIEHAYELVEKAYHHAPKIYFIMVPFLALVLKLIFKRRKELFFVDHAVFSLHVHTFWFIIFLGQSVLSAWTDLIWINLLLYVPCLIYIVVALQKTYKVDSGRAIGLSIVTMILYFTVFFLLISLVFIYYLYEFYLKYS